MNPWPCRVDDFSSTGALSAQMLALEMVEVKLLGGLFLQTQKVADGMPADQVADLLGGVFDVVGGTFDGLGHGNDVYAVRPPEAGFCFQPPNHDQIVEPIDFAMG